MSRHHSLRNGGRGSSERRYAAPMTTQERFFYDHAGYSHDPQTETRAQARRRRATELAEAERWAESVGMTFAWEWDADGDLGDHECTPSCLHQHEVTVCVANYRSGACAAVLGGIIDADANYRRVIEAELAAEAKAEVLESVYQAI